MIPDGLNSHEVGYYLAYTVLKVKTADDLMRLFKCSRRTANRKLKVIRRYTATVSYVV